MSEHRSLEFVKAVRRRAMTKGQESTRKVRQALWDLIEAGTEALGHALGELDYHPFAINALMEVLMRDPWDSESDEVLRDACAVETESFVDAELHDWVCDSVESMEQFLGAQESSTMIGLGAFVIQRGKPIRGIVEVCFWSTTIGRRVPWQRRTFEVRCLSALALHLNTWARVLLVKVEPEHPYNAGPLFDYHPERFRRSRRYSTAARKIHQHGGLPTAQDFQRVMELATAEMNARLTEVDRRAKLLRNVQATLVIEAEEQLVLAWLKFVATGRQIFDLPARMVELFRHTDADDIPVSMLRLPYAVQYLHFGPQPDLVLEPGWLLDGVYVEFHPSVPLLTFTVTARPAAPADVELWHAFGEPMVAINLAPEAFGLDLGSAVDHALARLDQHLRAEQSQGDLAAAEMFALGSGEVHVTTGARATRQLAQVERRTPMLRAALRLAVNALCYLTAYPDDITVSWPDHAPERLVKKAGSGPAAERARARSKLESLGYTQVNICGSLLRKPPPPAAAAAAETTIGLSHEEGVRTHWRRGHWRRQAHGEGRALRKLIWLMPTLVRGDVGAAAEQVPGHIYQVAADTPPPG